LAGKKAPRNSAQAANDSRWAPQTSCLVYVLVWICSCLLAAHHSTSRRFVPSLFLSSVSSSSMSSVDPVFGRCEFDTHADTLSTTTTHSLLNTLMLSSPFSLQELTFFLTLVHPHSVNLILVHTFISHATVNGIHTPSILHLSDLRRRNTLPLAMVMTMASSQVSLKFLVSTATQHWQKAYTIFMIQTADDLSVLL
jgi:hypothetical protein